MVKWVVQSIAQIICTIFYNITCTVCDSMKCKEYCIAVHGEVQYVVHLLVQPRLYHMVHVDQSIFHVHMPI